VTYYDAEDEIVSVVDEWCEYIEAETLSLDLVAGTVPDDVDRQESLTLAGHSATLGVKRA